MVVEWVAMRGTWRDESLVGMRADEMVVEWADEKVEQWVVKMEAGKNSVLRTVELMARLWEYEMALMRGHMSAL